MTTAKENLFTALQTLLTEASEARITELNVTLDALQAEDASIYKSLLGNYLVHDLFQMIRSEKAYRGEG